MHPVLHPETRAEVSKESGPCDIMHNIVRARGALVSERVQQAASSETSGQVNTAVRLLSGPDYSLKC